jgi:hypothetical protein
VCADGQLVEFRCGGQRGVDLWATDAGLALGARVSLILPLRVDRFTAEWPEADRGHLLEACNRAASVRIIEPGGFTSALAFDLRNERLVEHADLLVAVWTGIRRGGTFYTMCAARVRRVSAHEVILAPSSAADQPRGRGV